MSNPFGGDSLGGPPSVLFDFDAGEGVSVPSGWQAVAGRSIVAGGIGTLADAEGNASIGVTIDADHVAAGAGVAVISSPLLDPEPGHRYRIRLHFRNIGAGGNDMQFTWGAQVLINNVPAAASRVSVDANLIGNQNRFRILTLGAHTVRPVIFQLSAVKL